jgi:hypothetical protein
LACITRGRSKEENAEKKEERETSSRRKDLTGVK